MAGVRFLVGASLLVLVVSLVASDAYSLQGLFSRGNNGGNNGGKPAPNNGQQKPQTPPPGLGESGGAGQSAAASSAAALAASSGHQTQAASVDVSPRDNNNNNNNNAQSVSVGSDGQQDPDCEEDVRFGMCKSILRYWRCGSLSDDQAAIDAGASKGSPLWPEANKHSPADYCSKIADLMPSLKDECDEVLSNIRGFFIDQKKSRGDKSRAEKKKHRASARSGSGGNFVQNVDEDADNNDPDALPLELQRESKSVFTCEFNDGKGATKSLSPCPESILCSQYIKGTSPRFSPCDLGTPKFCECTDTSQECEWPVGWKAPTPSQPDVGAPTVQQPTVPVTPEPTPAPAAGDSSVDSSTNSPPPPASH